MMIRGRYRLRILNLKVNSGKQRIFHGVNDESSSCRLENASKDPRGLHIWLLQCLFALLLLLLAVRALYQVE